MTPNEAFDFVLKKYKINANQLAKNSGVDKAAISKFRNSHHTMNSDKLQKLIQNLPPQAIAHFCTLGFYPSAKPKK